jgi:hypothetical protein
VGNDGVNWIDYLGLEGTAINDGADALSYWRSGEGGTVEAGGGLITDLRYSIPFLRSKQETKEAIEKQIRELGRTTLCNGSSGTIDRKAGTIGIGNAFNFSVGSVDLDNKAYQVEWKNVGSTLGFAKIQFSGERDISFEDEYVFNGKWYNPKTWLSDNLPEVVAGDGKPFSITGGWTDKLRGEFSLCCWGY